jgi:hypothetical protein
LPAWIGQIWADQEVTAKWSWTLIRLDGELQLLARVYLDLAIVEQVTFGAGPANKHKAKKPIKIAFISFISALAAACRATASSSLVSLSHTFLDGLALPLGMIFQEFSDW